MIDHHSNQPHANQPHDGHPDRPGDPAGGTISRRQSSSKRKALIISLIVVIAGILVAWSAIPNPVPPDTVHTILDALDGAERVELLLCSPNPVNMTKPAVLQEQKRVVLNADECARLRQIFEQGQFFHRRLQVIRCWIPHHAVRITRNDGSPMTIELCFSCRKFKIERFPLIELPGHWERDLRRMFEQAGLSKHLND